MAEEKDYYKILGVDKAASADEGLRRRAATEPDFKALIAPTAYTNANK